LLVLTTACASLSGLDSLEIGDAASNADVITPNDAPSEPPPPLSDTGTPDAVGGSYCSSYTAWTWCADFDEGDIGIGFALGAKAKWSNISSATPALSGAYLSAPNGAGFEGAKAESLSFVAAPSSGNKAYEVIGQLRVEVMADQANDVLTIQLTSSYALVLKTVRAQSAYTLTLAEAAVSADAGFVGTPHDFGGSYPTVSWVAIDITVTSTQVTATVDNKASVTFTRMQSGSSSSVTTTFGFDTSNWNGQWENVRIGL
jgi:hypothetical protein